MNSEIISWLIILEVALPFVILSIVLFSMILGANKKNKRAARKLIVNIKKNENDQRNEIFKFLTEKLSIEPVKAKRITKKIISERKFLFRNLLSGLLDRNAGAIARLEEDLSRISEHYHDLEIAPNVVEAENDVEDISEEQAELITDLKLEVKTLKHEVHVTLTTLNNIFGEFSSMFGEQVPDTEMSVDQIITAMETFSGKNGAINNGSEDIEADNGRDLIEDGVNDEQAFDEEAFDAFSEAVDENDIIESEDISNELGVSGVSSEESAPDFEIDSELDDIDSALDELELGETVSGESTDEEPSWDEAFEESGDIKSEGS